MIRTKSGWTIDPGQYDRIDFCAALSRAATYAVTYDPVTRRFTITPEPG